MEVDYPGCLRSTAATVLKGSKTSTECLVKFLGLGVPQTRSFVAEWRNFVEDD